MNDMSRQRRLSTSRVPLSTHIILKDLQLKRGLEYITLNYYMRIIDMVLYNRGLVEARGRNKAIGRK